MPTSREIQPKHNITLWLCKGYEEPDQADIGYYVIKATGRMLDTVGAEIFSQGARFPGPELNYRPIQFNEEARVNLEFIGLGLMGAYVLNFFGNVTASPDSDFHLIATQDTTDKGKWTYNLQVPAVVGTPGADGADGNTPLLRVFGAYVQVSYDNGASWTNLIALALITGPTGTTGSTGSTGATGSAGSNGITPQLRNNGTYIQYSLDLGVNWNNLVSLASITGATGATGATGSTGATGAAGANAAQITDTPVLNTGSLNTGKSRCGAAKQCEKVLEDAYADTKSKGSDVNSLVLTFGGALVGLTAGLGVEALSGGALSEVALPVIVASVQTILLGATTALISGLLPDLTNAQKDMLREAFYCNLAVDINKNVSVTSAALTSVSAFISSHQGTLTASQVSCLQGWLTAITLAGWTTAVYIGGQDESTDCNSDDCDAHPCNTTLDFTVNQQGMANGYIFASTTTAYTTSIYTPGVGFQSQFESLHNTNELAISLVNGCTAFTLPFGVFGRIDYVKTGSQTDGAVFFGFWYKDATGWHSVSVTTEVSNGDGSFHQTFSFGSSKPGVINYGLSFYRTQSGLPQPYITLKKMLVPC